MNEPLVSISDWTEWFWARAGTVEPFPRNLETSILRSLELTLIKRPHLDLHAVYQLASERGIPIPLLLESNRPLFACLLADRGTGVIFQNGTVSEAEQRFSLAHELGHFLLDHLAPRLRALNLLGESIRPVLDGERLPTTEERLDGVLAGVPLGTQIILMDRDEDGLAVFLSALQAEDQADRFALELLAPVDAVRIELGTHSKWRRAGVISCLIQQFGLPIGVAENYADFLVGTVSPQPTFRDWFEEKT